MTCGVLVIEELGVLLQQALDAKAREVGGKYSHRDLERDSGVNYSYVSKAIHGTIPSKAVIRAWSKALAPHLPLDDALMSAGFLPDDPDKASALVRLGRLSKDVLNRIVEEAGGRSGTAAVTPRDGIPADDPAYEHQRPEEQHPPAVGPEDDTQGQTTPGA